MKYLILLFSLFMASSNILAIQKDYPEQIDWKGGHLPPILNNIQVNIWNNTVTTTFLKDVTNATITVKKKSGEVVQKESLDAKTFDQVQLTLDNYQKGKYIIEIEIDKYRAEGEF